ncbi:MAG: hypothetical protein AB2L26_10415 [Ignavibacteria bacterium]
MSIRPNGSSVITLPSVETYNNRKDIRDFILSKWMSETPGTKYRYFVENIGPIRIYLERPASLNKGCDFKIFAENVILFKNGNDKPPSHDYIITDLANKKTHLSATQWADFMDAIKVIYDCGTYSDAQLHINALPAIGLSYELILKIVRWFFIEQDISYWSGTGRDMFYTAIQNV